MHTGDGIWVKERDRVNVIGVSEAVNAVCTYRASQSPVGKELGLSPMVRGQSLLD
jgi:hypothetical protein